MLHYTYHTKVCPVEAGSGPRVVPHAQQSAIASWPAPLSSGSLRQDVPSWARMVPEESSE
jgi:hypothetical protein